jgi:hypothetical protein
LVASVLVHIQLILIERLSLFPTAQKLIKATGLRNGLVYPGLGPALLDLNQWTHYRVSDLI